MSQWPKLEGRFPQVSGISFAFDGSKPSGSRIDPQFIKIGDEYLEPDKVYNMVTKAYLANGKDGYDVLAKCNQVTLNCEYFYDLVIQCLFLDYTKQYFKIK